MVPGRRGRALRAPIGALLLALGCGRPTPSGGEPPAPAAEELVRPDSVRPYARGSLVLAVHAASGVAVKGLADLGRPEVKKVALANPATAPYGAAGRQALERAGLWEGLVRDRKVVQAE